ncbi:hypothetical protein SteCoe_32774 [Stentor coeruleus]|uniref:Uncharacterized protein n=1 Tax=Stentor coeruleus TaxID=5963 RepID=A0A1R2AY97_9CILI|nr:hypothetical protein SteCoe_32774 [Stentor coeruleus]
MSNKLKTHFLVESLSANFIESTSKIIPNLKQELTKSQLKDTQSALVYRSIEEKLIKSAKINQKLLLSFLNKYTRSLNEENTTTNEYTDFDLTNNFLTALDSAINSEKSLIIIKKEVKVLEEAVKSMKKLKEDLVKNNFDNEIQDLTNMMKNLSCIIINT